MTVDYISPSGREPPLHDKKIRPKEERWNQQTMWSWTLFERPHNKIMIINNEENNTIIYVEVILRNMSTSYVDRPMRNNY
jgi:hypothetical protein